MAADQLARLFAIACRAIEQPAGPVFGEFVPTPDEPGEPEVVRWPPASKAPPTQVADGDARRTISRRCLRTRSAPAFVSSAAEVVLQPVAQA